MIYGGSIWFLIISLCIFDSLFIQFEKKNYDNNTTIITSLTHTTTISAVRIFFFISIILYCKHSRSQNSS